jgi:hypothetical protein
MAKVRNGFISNSSSSSFIIIGTRISSYELPKNGKVMAVGSDHGEGIDIFEVDKKMQEYLSKNADIADKLEFYLTDVCGGSEDGLEIPDDIKLKKGSRLYSFDKSYHSTQDLADLKERYN